MQFLDDGIEEFEDVPFANDRQRLDAVRRRSFELRKNLKKVTSWAAIIAVPTAIPGFYGQNLPYPGFGTYLGVRRLDSAHPGIVVPVVRHVQTSRLAVRSHMPDR